MKTTVVTIPTDAIVDWDSFHEVFRTALGFPDFYGRNMDAWIDCMTSIDDPSSGMTDPSVAPGELFALRIDDASALPCAVCGVARMRGVRELSAH